MRHLFCCACAFALVHDVAALAAEPMPIRTPYARQKPLAIRRVVMPASPARQYACIEMAVEVAATYGNPFDSSDITVDARVALPNGKTRSVPGFFYRPFDRKLDHGREVLTPNAEPGWRVRWTPPLSGAYTVVVTVRDRTGERRSEPVSFTAVAGEDPGFGRISPRDRRYFEFDNGRAFFPIGLNMCWPGRIVQELTVKVGADGEARVPLPEIAKDLAVRLRASSPLRASKTTSWANILEPRRLPPWLP